MAAATTNISALLLGELQSLSTEARRKHPDIKEAAERVIVILRGIKATTTDDIARELSKSDEVIRPFVLACNSNNQRLTTVAVHCLQQLVSRQAISPGSVRETLSTLNHVSGQSIEVQVKVLQMVLPLVTIYSDAVGGETLVEAFALCLALQRSRDPVVSNTAAAILRQVVVAVFDRVVAEDRELGEPETSDQDLTRRSAKDAYFVLQDLCLMAADVEPIFIRVDHAVDKRLVLELIESVLTNHAAVVARHAAMAQTLRERLAPFIVNFFAERASFTLAVRCTRIAWLFVRDLHRDLTPECEIILSVFSRLIVDSGSGSAKQAAAGAGGGRRRASVSTKTISTTAVADPGSSGGGGGFPLFYRVLALEVVRDLLQNAALLHQLYLQYDGRVDQESAGKDEGCHVILDLISAVCRVVIERPDLSSTTSGIPSALADNAITAAGDGTVVAATASTGDVSGHHHLQQQIGANTCRIRMEMYKLLDKQEPPNIPDTYMFYLATSAIISFSEGLVSSILAQCTECISCKVQLQSSGVGGGGSRKLVEVSVPILGHMVAEPGVAGGFLKHAWTAIYSVYEFIVGVLFDDSMFMRMLDSARRLVESAGALGLIEARDSLLTLLCRGSLPVSQKQQHSSDVPNSRQVHCLGAVIGSTQFLASTLGPAWYMVLATVQYVEEALYVNRGRQVAAAAAAGSATTPVIGGSDDNIGQSSVDLMVVRDEFARLLVSVRRWAARSGGGDAVLWMIRGLRVLGSDQSGVEIQLDELEEMRRLRNEALGSDRLLPLQPSRGGSGAALQSRPTFAVEEMRGFAVANIDLLMGAATDDIDDIGQQAWMAIIDDLLSTATSITAPAGIRTQACSAVSDVVLAAMDLVVRISSEVSGFRAMVESGEAQVRILRPLSQMMTTGDVPGQHYHHHQQSTVVRKLTLDTLHRVLQASGHSITAAWDVVFDIIQSVESDDDYSAGGALMRSVFPCLQLICTDYLADLPPGCLRRCIGALLVQFGGQQQDLNIALTAIGQAWALCDYFHGAAVSAAAGNSSDKGSGSELPPLISEQMQQRDDDAAAVIAGLWREDLAAVSRRRAQQVLWLLLLHALAQLGRDARRAEVRLGAIQTLFRAVDMHGAAAFDEWVWDGAVWAVVLPLAQSAVAQRAQVLDQIGTDQIGASEAAGDSNSGSGMVAEDPGRLLRRQWDETASAALLGAAKTWECGCVWRIGRADDAWRGVWLMTQTLLTGGEEAGWWRRRTRDGVAGALGSARALIRSADHEDRGAIRSADLGDRGAWRAAWEAWVAMGLGATRQSAEEEEGATPNVDADDNVVVSQDVLCALVELGTALMGGLLGAGAGAFGADDCAALLRVVRGAVAFGDAPLHASDAAGMARVQALALDAVARALEAAVAEDDDAAAALAVDELAAMAVLPYAQAHAAAEAEEEAAGVVLRAGREYLSHQRRDPSDRRRDPSGRRRDPGGRRVAPTFEALGCAAAARLGAALSGDSGARLAGRVLARGAWLSAVEALGVHAVRRAEASWFVRAVPGAMQRLRAGAELSAAWMAVAAVAAQAVESAEHVFALSLLDAVAESSVAAADGCPAAYWRVLLDAVERGVSDGALGVAALCLGWLERLSSAGCAVPEWVACSAASRLVRSAGAIVDAHVADRALFGRRGPLPVSRAGLLRRVLQGLAQLQCRPN
ncbi:Endocytosis and vacuole integrity protein, partial [Coemansia sp. RSA 2424]